MPGGFAWAARRAAEPRPLFSGGEATVTGGIILGVWPNGVAGAATLLSGTVAPAGDVTIELRPGTGSRMLAPAHLYGTLHNGHLEATGTLVNGRSVSLTWHRD